MVLGETERVVDSSPSQQSLATNKECHTEHPSLIIFEVAGCAQSLFHHEIVTCGTKELELCSGALAECEKTVERAITEKRTLLDKETSKSAELAELRDQLRDANYECRKIRKEFCDFQVLAIDDSTRRNNAEEKTKQLEDGASGHTLYDCVSPALLSTVEMAVYVGKLGQVKANH
ncbi:hypothetical protein KIN20_017724 [Parelaphostrongylus tenuis]|uniref:Uncharacterized protein n=1 Tax=Parelaphostrongylus tenuis TaxID=148309 RepID=A0AAD5QRN7_PARTN|nr:hypothetical protein KIN20_017724 [Parelaphostrongylus tenuis]